MEHERTLLKARIGKLQWELAVVREVNHALDVESHDQALDKDLQRLKLTIGEHWHHRFEGHEDIVAEIICDINKWQGEIY